MSDEPKERKPRPVIIGIGLGSRLGGRRDARAGLVFGAVIALVGLALLMDNMGIVAVERLYRFWPLILIFMGIGYLWTASGRVFGSVLVVAGILFQLDALGILHFTWGAIWALILIAMGVAVMWGSVQRKSSCSPTTKEEETPSTMNAAAIFGGVERRISTQDFQFGRVVAIFGGAEIDFRQANMQKNEAELEVNAIFGGVEIRVPDNWQVVSRGQYIFGGFSDKTRDPRPEDVSGPNARTLILSGVAAFAGVEIKN